METVSSYRPRPEARPIGTEGFLLALTVGAAALALWCHVRWPGAAPGTLTGAVLRVLLGLALMQVGLVILDAAAGSPAGVAVAVVVGVVTPVLTFAFLSALWIMKVFAEALRGSF